MVPVTTPTEAETHIGLGCGVNWGQKLGHMASVIPKPKPKAKCIPKVVI